MNKWEQILNKCSLDLMLPIVEKTKAEKEKTDADIKLLESQIAAQVNTEEFNTITNNITSSLKSFEKELQSYKLKKFERDTKDYADGKIYEWRDERRKLRRPRPAHRPPANERLSASLSKYDSSQTSDADSQRDHKPFLANAKPRRNWRGGGGGGDA